MYCLQTEVRDYARTAYHLTKAAGARGLDMTEHYLVIRAYDNYSAVKIVTSYLRMANAAPDLDWMAYADNWETGDPIGHGATEEEAINRLREELQSRVHPQTGELD
jgi:hypothetical protein